MIEINNLTKFSINKRLLMEIGEKILKTERPGEELDLSVVFANKAKITELNFIYRGKNEPTDVLSFASDGYSEELAGLPKGLGEIMICPSEIDFDKKDALSHIFIHGLLHLLGNHHENLKEAKKMQAKEQEYLNFFKK
ncbi:rRNA maturation RNase YbeY [Patescibacteria group bacterium]|nr:rRNA maturation RNase YbeY [Patescibacteria group bacterium]MBU4162334.1 rRNA maturation RNase YbeY [Patescibacteria group bacterium]